MGSELAPVTRTSRKESMAPRVTIAACNTHFAAKVTPGRDASETGRREATSTPPAMAKTGAPMTGTKWPRTVATIAMGTTTPSPGPRAATRRG
jgi:hypothetical protein